MSTATVSGLTLILFNIILVNFILVTFGWALAGFQTLYNDHKREKRDQEYHQKRMSE